MKWVVRYKLEINISMPIVGKIEKRKKVGGEDEDVFVVTFNNGAKDQLENLRAHYKQADLAEVVILGISLLQKIKEGSDAKLVVSGDAAAKSA